jgi:hypothetical protein
MNHPTLRIIILNLVVKKYAPMMDRRNMLSAKISDN